MGIVDAAIADQDFGLVQVYGYRSSSQVFQTGTTQAAGLPLVPGNAVSYLQTSGTSITSSVALSTYTHFPFMAALVSSVASAAASATVSPAIFIKAMGF